MCSSHSMEPLVMCSYQEECIHWVLLQTYKIIMRILFKLNIVFVAAATLLLSCKKSYLDTPATDRIPEEQALTTTDGCWNLLNGVHRILYASHLGRQDMVGQ